MGGWVLREYLCLLILLTLKHKSFPVNSFGYNTVTWVSLFKGKLKHHIECPPISHKECKRLCNTFLMWIWRRVFKSAKQKQEKIQTCNEVMEWFQLKFRDNQSWPDMKEDAISCIISWDRFCIFIINSKETPWGTRDKEIQLGPQAEVNQCVTIAPKTLGVPPFCLFLYLSVIVSWEILNLEIHLLSAASYSVQVQKGMRPDWKHETGHTMDRWPVSYMAN